MTATDLRFGQTVIWDGQQARVVDILWRVDKHRIRVQIRVPGQPLRWVRPDALQEAPDVRGT